VKSTVEDDEAAPDYWPPTCTPRRRWRFLAIWRPVLAVWRRLPRLGRISLSTLVIGSAVLIVGATVMLRSEQQTVESESPHSPTADWYLATTGGATVTGQLFVAYDGAVAPAYSPPVPVRVLPPVSPPAAAVSPGVYAKGMRQLGSLRFGPGRLTSSLTFTPSSLSLLLRSAGGCLDPIPAGVALHVHLTVNGDDVEQEVCTANGAQAEALPVSADGVGEDLGELGIEPGTVITVNSSRCRPATTRCHRDPPRCRCRRRAATRS
jgi:hypothetical protein